MSKSFRQVVGEDFRQKQAISHVCSRNERFLGFVQALAPGPAGMPGSSRLAQILCKPVPAKQDTSQSSGYTISTAGLLATIVTPTVVIPTLVILGLMACCFWACLSSAQK